MTNHIQRSWLGGFMALSLMVPMTGMAQETPLAVDTMRLQAQRMVTTDTFFGTVQATAMVGLSYEARGCVVEVSEQAKRDRVATAGQVLVRLDGKRSLLALRTAESRLAELGAQIEERELDIVSAAADDKRRQQELDLTTAEYERNSTMLGRGLINETTMEGVERRFMEARFAADRAQEAIATARAAKRRAQIALEIGELELQTAQLSHDMLVLTAPIDGVLVGFETNVGDCVQEGERAAQIYAPSQKSVDVFILIRRLSASGPNGIAEGSEVRITRVNDQTCGGTITRFDTEADQERIFREFERLDRNSSVNEGLGLGLAIVERACDQLRHPLGVQSTVGQGTRFFFSAQRVNGPEEVPILKRSPAARQRLRDTGLIVLLVENDNELRRALSLLIERWGGSVLDASNAEEADALLNDLGILPDALLVDYNLGDGKQDGLSLVRQLRARDAQLPARLMSANRSNELHLLCDAAQVGLMTKPINTEDLESFLFAATRGVDLT